jgi:hypothetical protein
VITSILSGIPERPSALIKSSGLRIWTLLMSKAISHHDGSANEPANRSSILQSKILFALDKGTRRSLCFRAALKGSSHDYRLFICEPGITLISFKSNWLTENERFAREFILTFHGAL